MRELLHGSDLQHARRVEEDGLVKAADALVPPELRRNQHALGAARDQAVRLGRFTEGPLRDDDLLVGAKDLASHQHIIGVSGSGSPTSSSTRSSRSCGARRSRR